jgi:hypothetical protein
MNLPAHRAAFIACGNENHSLDKLAGYHVRVTINDEGQIVNGPVIAVIDGATNYSAALDVVHAYRDTHPNGYAIIDSVHTCGHSSADWDHAERAEIIAQEGLAS